MYQVSSDFPFSSVDCPTSKSYANRALILGALKKDKIILSDLPEAQDVLDMMTLLSSIGLKLQVDGTSVNIENSFPDCEVHSKDVVELNLGEGGTTVRFIIALLCLGQNKYLLEFEGRMKERPMSELYDHLRSLGAEITVREDLRVEVKGPLNFNANTLIKVDCSKTTQFASALMHLSLTTSLKVETSNVRVSQKYLDLTNKMIHDFSKFNQITIAPDYSSAGYFIAYAALNKNLLIKNIFSIDEVQADSKLIDILRDIGVQIDFSESGMKVYKANSFKQGIIVDGSECIDLVPTLAYVASFLPYESRISNIEALEYKECDRLVETIRILEHFNVNCKYEKMNNRLIISPSKAKILNNQITVEPDHRMIMVSALFLKTLGGGAVAPHLNVSKSFPKFFDYFS